jgi:hypothetical protein
MQSLIQKYLARGLSDFAGLSISGTIPIQQDLINELLADFLSDGSADEPAPPAVQRQARDINPQQLLKSVKTLKVQADAGTITVSFQLRV